MATKDVSQMYMAKLLHVCIWQLFWYQVLLNVEAVGVLTENCETYPFYIGARVADDRIYCL